MNIASLFARIGIKADSKKLESFKNQLTNVKKTMAAVVVSAGAVSLFFTKITKDALDSAAALRQFNSETGASTTELQKWQSVAAQTNNSSEALASSVRNLASNREALRLGSGNIKGFQLLGIDANQDPFKILDELREKIVGLAPAMQRNVISQMGLSSSLIQVLQLSNREFDEMAGRAFIIPPSAIEGLDRTRGALAVMNDGLEYIKTTIASALSPEIEKLAQGFAEWVRLNEEEIIQVAKELFNILKMIGQAIGTVFNWFNNFIQSTIGWKNAIIGIIALFVALNAAVLLPVAGIILLIALIEDIVRYGEGKSSVIGRLFEKFPELEGVFNVLTSAVGEFLALLDSIFTGNTEKMNEILDGWGLFGDAIQRVIQFAGGLWTILEGIFTLDFSKIGEGLSQAVGSVGGLLRDVLGIPDPNQPTEEEEAFQNSMGYGESGLLPAGMSTRLGTNPTQLSNQNNTNNNNVTINVNSVAEADEALRRTNQMYSQSADERGGVE